MHEVIFMKQHDKRRLNKFVLDEERAAEEYNEMGLAMQKNGCDYEARLFFNMTEDESRHAQEISEIIKHSPWGI